VVAGQALRGKDVSEVCGISPQEASRHLGRLAALGLVERGPDRAHRATELGRRVHARLQEVAQSVAAAQAMPRHAAPPAPLTPVVEGFLAPVRTEESQRAR
jgi:DNA-binding MarR family transcriptional regulator